MRNNTQPSRHHYSDVPQAVGHGTAAPGHPTAPGAQGGKSSNLGLVPRLASGKSQFLICVSVKTD